MSNYRDLEKQKETRRRYHLKNREKLIARASEWNKVHYERAKTNRTFSVKKYERRHIEMGLCARCTKPLFTKYRCEYHAIKNREYTRAYEQRRMND